VASLHSISDKCPRPSRIVTRRPGAEALQVFHTFSALRHTLSVPSICVCHPSSLGKTHATPRSATQQVKGQARTPKDCCNDR
jgi:hypothetical protein